MAGLGMSHSPTLMTSGGINQVFIDTGQSRGISDNQQVYKLIDNCDMLLVLH